MELPLLHLFQYRTFRNLTVFGQIKTMTEEQRLKQANEFIKVIAGCGRRFFHYKGFVSSFELSSDGKVYFTDYYTKKAIDTHASACADEWDGFTSGGTLQRLVEDMRDYIKRGQLLRLRYFRADWGDGFRNPWGYGEELEIVHKAASNLGVAE